MRLFSLIIILFLLGAFAIGVSLTETELIPQNITTILDQTNLTEIELSRGISSEDAVIDTNSIISIIESYVRFIITLSFEILKVGINFGYDNPDYFEPAFIVNIIRWIVILIIVGLLIKPVTYVVILLILLGIWIKDRIINKKGGKQ